MSDYTFPTFSGLEALRIRQERAPETPIIFVSGTIGEEKSIELIRTGLTDYALKDNLFTLGHKVKRALCEARERQHKKQLEAELIINEGKLTRALQLAHLGNWEFDFFKRNVMLSDEGCRIHGLPEGDNEQSFEKFYSFIHPEDFEFVHQKLASSINSLGMLSIRYRIVQRNGSVRFIHFESKTQLNADGICTGLYGILQDVTEIVFLENKLLNEKRINQSEIVSAVLTAQENERHFIGRELHDNLNQILGATKMYIELAKENTVDQQMLLAKSADCIVSVIEEIRKISKTLAGPGMHMGLFNSIKVLMADLTLAHPIDIKFRENNTREKQLNEKMKLTVFRIVQEQMNNIIKHSGATQAMIRLQRYNNEIVLQISDNGSGYDSSKIIAGVGIQNIKSRAELHNGNVSIKTSPGKGYTLKVALSIDNTVYRPVAASSAGILVTPDLRILNKTMM